MASTQGFSKGFTVQDYQGTENGIPLLSSFYFRFERERTLGTSGRLLVPPPPPPTGPVDHHINSIAVLPGGLSEDLSPNADLSPTKVENGKIQLMFADEDPTSPDDGYFYNVAHSILPFASGRARRFQFRDVGCTGKCEQILPPPPSFGHSDVFGSSIFVLVGFSLQFTGGRDRHIDTVAVFEDNGKLTVELKDKHVDLDDVFGYIVDYAWVSHRPGQNIQLGEESGSTSGGVRVDLPPGQKVIRGFRFDFKSQDHHSREIGVRALNDNLQVYYSDKNGDDPFRWRVRWASIGPQVVGPV